MFTVRLRVLRKAATYNNDSLYLVGIVDFIDYSYTNWDATQPNPKDDQYTVTLGGNYDFGFMKLYASGMYFSDMLASEFQGHNNMQSITTKAAEGNWVSYKGYSLQLGTTVPAWGGNGEGQLGLDGRLGGPSLHEGCRKIRRYGPHRLLARLRLSALEEGGSLRGCRRHEGQRQHEG